MPGRSSGPTKGSGKSWTSGAAALTDEVIEALVCPAEDHSYCGLIGPARYTPTHLCDFDEGHDGVHECLCGHVWDEGEQ